MTRTTTVWTIIFLAILLLLIPQAFAQSGKIKLLAVGDAGGNATGSVADLQLVIQPGSGRVFLETFPLTKIDTQISTRFAQQIACKHIGKDCSRYDFFYTIQSNAAIVGGPSAGAAIATLTAAVLEDLKINQSIAMTGTINSGALIGPVGSTKEKIYAAKKAGLNKVMIPQEQMTYEEGNKTLNITDLAARWEIEVAGAENLDDSLYAFTGKNFSIPPKKIEVDPDYKETMQLLAEQLCTRAENLSAEMKTKEKEIKQNEDERTQQFIKSYEEAQKLLDKGRNALKNSTHYSAASFCFGANVAFSSQISYLENISSAERAKIAQALMHKIEDMDTALTAKKRKTITDLQAYMIVKDRILESRETIKDGKNTSGDISYAAERLESARTWQQFMGTGDGNFKLNNETLKSSCLNKMSEVGERYQYINLFFPSALGDLQSSLDNAYRYYETGNYELCLYKAIQTSAEVNVLTSVMGVNEDGIDHLLKKKLQAAHKEITKQIDKGAFPILAYSYYEYANTLKDDQKISALIYAEYALEMSDLDIYLGSEKENTAYEKIMLFVYKYRDFLLIFWGAAVGAIIYEVISAKMKKQEKYTLHQLPRRKERKRIKLRS
jgi:uncharacterized protein